jgi:hypothetical protein
MNSYKALRLTPCIIASANTGHNSLSMQSAPLKLLEFVSLITHHLCAADI